MNCQQKRVFFDTTGLYPQLSEKPSDEQIRLLLADNNQKCPLSKVIVSEENRGNMRILKRFAFSAFTDPFHSVRGMNFAIYAQPGQGKTYIVKQWAKTLEIPFLFIQSDTLTDTWMLFQLIIDCFAKNGIELEPQSDDYHIALPPCIVFFDEAHALNTGLRTGGLLNAMEPNDAVLRVRQSRNTPQYIVDCEEVCFIAATTDPGLLHKQSQAFYDRFRNHIEWKPAGPAEIAKIVTLDSLQKSQDYPEKYQMLPNSISSIVAKYETVPRKAIAFADLMQLEMRMMNSSWEEAAAVIAEDNGIDHFGMPYYIVKILAALAKHPVSERNMTTVCQCRREQFDSQIKPILLSDIKDRGPLAVPTSKGWTITESGLNELDKRNINYKD